MLEFNPAQRRYNRRVLALSALYAILLVAVSLVFRAHRIVGPAAYLLAILPALPLFGVFLAIGRYLVEESDEYLRMIETRKSLVATGFMLVVTTGWGFLQSFDLLPRVDFYWAAILWFGGLGFGACVQKLTK